MPGDRHRKSEGAENNKNPQQKQESSPSHGADAPKEAATPKNGKSVRTESDQFWIKKVFTDAFAAFQFKSPAIGSLSDDGLFVFDTNALLAPYELGGKSIEDIRKIYVSLSRDNRLFIPDQAAREFAKNRGFILDKVFNKLHAAASEQPAAQVIDCPILQGLTEYAEFQKSAESIKELRRTLLNKSNEIRAKLSEWEWNDPVSQLYRDIFTQETIVSHDTSEEEMISLMNWRYEHGVPPGYKDRAKADGGIGDFDIWKTILKLGVTRSRNIIFVCGEQKHDWIYKSQSTPLGPRLELCYEFHESTGMHFGLVSWPRFLELAEANRATVEEAIRSRQHELEISFRDNAAEPHQLWYESLPEDSRKLAKGPTAPYLKVQNTKSLLDVMGRMRQFVLHSMQGPIDDFCAQMNSAGWRYLEHEFMDASQRFEWIVDIPELARLQREIRAIVASFQTLISPDGGEAVAEWSKEWDEFRLLELNDRCAKFVNLCEVFHKRSIRLLM